MQIYGKSYVAGDCVDLGNKAGGVSGTISNYIVFYGTGVAPPTPTCTLDSRFQQDNPCTGIEYYTDRTYTLTGVPAGYVGMDMIKTPNDERNLDSCQQLCDI